MFIDMNTMVQRKQEREPLYAEIQAEWAELMRQEDTKHLTLDDFLAEARRTHRLRGWETELIRRRIIGLRTDTEIREEPGGPEFEAPRGMNGC